MPVLHGGGFGHRPAAAGVHDADPGGHVGHDELAEADAYRRISLELLFVERNHVCAVCVSNGHCELQTMATAMGINTVRFAYNYPKLAVDHIASALRARSQPVHPVHALRARVRRAGRCTRVGNHRARHSCASVSDLNQNVGRIANCTNCGKCVQVCPTGALAEKGWAVEEMVKRNDQLQPRWRTEKGAQV